LREIRRMMAGGSRQLPRALHEHRFHEITHLA
jgi:hypothetical protein